MSPPRLSQQVAVAVAVVLCMAGTGWSDIASDREECTDQLVGLSTCLSYVQGSAKSPTPDCCTGFKQVVSKGLKCLCVLIKDRNDPSLGLKFDVYRALSLPTKCDLQPPSNVSTCPKLVGIPENSPQAKEFYKFEEVVEGKGSPTDAGNATKNSTGIASSGGNHVSSGRRERSLRVEMGGVKISSLVILVFLLVLVF
ncbi:protein YLS3-like [Iris pallida]|uniref:Protein YLS3-like n=1 Tax=Iris pallida TaxID=29817 RepID=A0AAX6IJ98_IRIPA|nr:protein YLS3-like [Iris pallida]KAJ6853356.1 protein YLS3-like [Iris pallida]